MLAQDDSVKLRAGRDYRPDCVHDSSCCAVCCLRGKSVCHAVTLTSLIRRHQRSHILMMTEDLQQQLLSSQQAGIVLHYCICSVSVVDMRRVWEISPDDLIMGDVLGRGASGV